jgi:hypothetical protein
MFARPTFFLFLVQAALLLCSVEARIRLLERDGRAIYGRSFGQVQPPELRKLAAACGGGVCISLAVEAVSHLASRSVLIVLSIFPGSALTIEGLQIIDILSWTFRLHPCCPTSRNVRSRTWLIKLSVRASFYFHARVRDLTRPYRCFSPIRPRYSGQDDCRCPDVSSGRKEHPSRYQHESTHSSEFRLLSEGS